METYKSWQYEYLYFLKPELDPKGTNHEQIMKEMQATLFMTEEARIFSCGFEAAREMIERLAEAHYNAVVEL